MLARLKFILDKPELASLILLLVLMLFFQWQSHGVFFSQDNWQAILSFLPEIALVTLGVGVLMIAGEFDLSVGAVFALVPMVMAVLMAHHNVPFHIAFPIAMLVACIIGLINGVVTLYFRIPSFITTIGMLYIARSLAVVISGGFPPLLPEGLPTWLFSDFLFGSIRVSMIWLLVIAVLLILILSFSNLGNWIKATGGFEEAAKAMGIPTSRVKIGAFILSAFLAGLAGVIQVLRLSSPLPSLGEGFELQAVAASVIGGISLTGGVGSVSGALVGVLLIQVIDNGLILIGLDASWFKFAIGTLLILAVVGRTWLLRTSQRLKIKEA